MKKVMSMLGVLLLTPCLLWGGEEQVALSFTNSPITEVLNRYAQLTGKTVLCQPGLGATVNLTTKPIPKQQAIELIELALTQFNNFFIAPNDETMVLFIGGGQPTFPIPLITDPKKIPSGYQLITYQMHVRNLPIGSLTASLQAFLCGNARMSPSPDEKSLFITAPAALVRGLINVQDIVDVRPDPSKKQAADDKHAPSGE